LNSGPVSNISTTFSVYNRQATTINARANFSIIAASELGTPTKNTDIDPKAIRLWMRWLLDFTASNTPPIMSPTFLFWNSAIQMSSLFWQYDEYKALQSLLAFPITFFTENSYANPLMIAPSPDKKITYLPDEFSTSASTAKPYSKIRIDHSMFIAYISLEIVALGISWFVVLAMLLRRVNFAEVSSYPLVDFASKSVQENVPPASTGIHAHLSEITCADSSKIRTRLRDTRLVLRTDGGRTESEKWGADQSAPRRLVLLTDEDSGLEQLRTGLACR
jgi:hypothetical protein